MLRLKLIFSFFFDFNIYKFYLFVGFVGAGKTRFIGEIGLDFAPRRAESAQLQRTVFARIAAASRGKVLSVHAAKSVGVALDLMESVGLVAPGAPQGLKTRRVPR